MKVAVLQFFSWPERRVPIETVYARGFERIAIMDETGYDAVWLAEHHFNTYSVCPSIHMMGLEVAHRTKNLRIGTGVSVAAFYHPLRLAEEVALLDVLTGGRVYWGAGRGYDPTEFRAFDVSPEESRDLFFENVEIVLKAWTQERLTHHGKFHDFEDIEVMPKPHQKPHPPFWIAGTSQDSLEMAGARGYSILIGPHSTPQEIARNKAIYRAALEANGFGIAGREMPIARLLAVAETEAEAKEIARRGAEFSVGYVKLREPGVDPIERYLDRVMIHGTPDMVLDKILQLREEIDLRYLLCAPLSHGSFTLFTEKVLPRLLALQDADPLPAGRATGR